ncbi:MAG: UvrD-helicase domain-containing protein [Patescibacteria group bacterium]
MILDELNEQQQLAVKHSQGPLLILAGAGSGKTKTLVHRLAYLIQENITPANTILAVTFTNKAAQEMRARVWQLLGNKDRSLPIVGTFHSTSASFLRREAPRLGIIRQFTIYDESDQKRLFKSIIKEFGLPPKRYPLGTICSTISRAKSELIEPAGFLDWVEEDGFNKVIARIYERYEQVLQSAKALDFDDLIGKMVYLWHQFPELLQRYQERCRYILVDEYQDTNRAQYEWVRLLAGENKNLSVVGDDWQSIYSWRGADFGNILRFTKDYPQAKVIKLEQNYRSTKNIIAAGNAIMEQAKLKTDKVLWTDNPEGAKLYVVETIDEHSEADLVVSEILFHLNNENKDELTYQPLAEEDVASWLNNDQLKQLSNFAILYRTNAQSRVLEEALLKTGLPYQLIGGVKFYERKEVKDVLAYLRLLVNPYDAISFRRAITSPRRGIGEETVEKIVYQAQINKISLIEFCLKPIGLDLPLAKQKLLASFAELISQLKNKIKQLTVPEMISEIAKQSGLQDELSDGSNEGAIRLENIEELKTVAMERTSEPGSKGLVKFIEQVALVQDQDKFNQGKLGVTLMTLHAAKGLEFSVVFLVGMEEGLFPHINSMDDPKELDEERRLCYVGITRAKEKVYLIYTSLRTLVGTSFLGVPSRFISDIPEELLEWKRINEDQLV